MAMNKPQGHGRGLQAPVPVMPGFVKGALTAKALMDAYRARPEYQQHGYLTWINQAKLKDTQRKRMEQMLAELAAGNAYMGEPWTPPPPVAG